MENMESMENYEKELEETFRNIQEGDVITGTVLAVNEEEAVLDLKYYTQGIIKAEEFSNDPDFDICRDVQAGDVIEATVLRMDDGQGSILLSKKEANENSAFDTLKQMKEEEKVVTVKIKESVPGGVIAFLEGIRGFIPASQITAEYVEDTESWVGKEVQVQVITVEPEKQKLVLSGKKAAREKQQEERNHRISMIAPGTILEGTVDKLMPYGAFVSLGNGLSGLVHISQICQKRIAKPSEVLKEGQKVRVKVLNTDNQKISLSMKALEEEMVDADKTSSAEIEAYTSKESVGTGLSDLLSKLNL